MTVFDEIPESEHVCGSNAFFVIRDRFPVSEGHSLIISRRSDAVTYFDLSSDEKQELLQLIEEVKTELESKLSPDGYNIGMNCGAAAGQTVMQFHCHIIPRFNGDMDDPRGGVRLCIPSKGNYLKSN